jgi:hypothetical protein
MWKNVIKPIDSSNTRHYSEKLSAEEILIFEQVTAGTMQRLGYALDNNLGSEPVKFTPGQIAAFKEQNERMKAEARKEHKVDASHRAAQEKFLKEVKTRLGV